MSSDLVPGPVPGPGPRPCLASRAPVPRESSRAFWRATRNAGLGARDVAPLTGVDLDPVARVHEQWYLHRRPGLERRRLRHVRDGVATDAGLRLRDGQLDRTG